ncbi:outer membrane protein [Pseudoduganella flava]|uniref:Outer membrane beta-barrel protein n=1 Tax=Pseudoduganella flava TaxID=871742 RepID=A0A562PC88_9BURK|nr:OmpW family outer membrane protein [Pseudoduganella flava]QGZ40155.1 outer membrane beta-barrel protein [Pseudoduganella flava]TWI42105.1 outer membrane protein [Pseudoduganella flava]
MKKAVMAVMAVTVGMLAGQASAQESNWLVRARAVHIDPADKADPVGGVGASDRISVENKTIPEVDISYFFTKNIAAELVLTYPQKHEVYLDGKSIGTFKHLPPSLMAQYHFTPEKTISPYLGLGINWTTFSKNKLLNGQGSLEHDSFGLAAQAGVDFKLDKNWSLNVDVKKVQIRSDVMIAGTKVSKVKVDPVLLGVGVGYRF